MITEKTVRYNGVRTRALEVAGEGTPFVLLHGFADSADTWRGMLAELERRGRAAVALDLPGFGAADRLAPGEILPQLDAFVDDVLSGYESLVLAGNSLGAAASVRAATRGSGTIRAVVTLDEPLLATHWTARYVRRPKEPWGFRALTSVPVPRRMVTWAGGKVIDRLIYAERGVITPEVTGRWAAVTPDYRAVGRMLRQARQVALETAGGYIGLDRISRPLLIVHGAKDRIIPVGASVRLHRQVPHSKLCVLDHCGHCPQLDDPVGVTDLVTRFIDNHLDAATEK